MEFQSPRGDFGFLKPPCGKPLPNAENRLVSIPSRGFWFFEDQVVAAWLRSRGNKFQSPRGDFGFLK